MKRTRRWWHASGFLAMVLVWTMSSGCCSKSDSNKGGEPGAGAVQKQARQSVEDETAQKARELLKRGEAVKARDLAKEALKEHPKHIELHRVYQDAMRAIGGQEQTLASEYEALLKANPNSALFYYLAGRSVILEDPVEAEMRFRKGIELDPGFLWNHLALGALRSRNGDNFAAIQTYEKALKTFPNSADLYFNLAEAHFSIGAHRTALEAAEKALKLKPDFALAHELVAKIHLARGVNDLAAKEAKQALALDPDLGGANMVMAEVLLKQGDQEAARKYATRALELGQDLSLALKLKLQLEIPPTSETAH